MADNPFERTDIRAIMNRVAYEALRADKFRKQLQRRGVSDGEIDSIIAEVQTASKSESDEN